MTHITPTDSFLRYPLRGLQTYYNEPISTSSLANLSDPVGEYAIINSSRANLPTLLYHTVVSAHHGALAFYHNKFNNSLEQGRLDVIKNRTIERLKANIEHYTKYTYFLNYPAFI